MQNDYHHLDVWQHTLLALRELDALLAELPAELADHHAAIHACLGGRIEGGGTVLALTRLALLLHDIGKPQTRREEPGGHISFIGHQQLGVELIEPDLERLRFSGAEREFLNLMIREHLRLGFYCGQEPLPPKLIYRFIRTLADAALPQLLHSLADCRATQGLGSADSLSRHLAAAAQIADNFIHGSRTARPPELLDGNEIMRLLDIQPGPLVGRYKEAMLEATAEGRISTAEEARDFVVSLPRSQLLEHSED